uniref:Reverse transcriptase domain-containing protein n=1 Tax=Photinus pyralis TaxID=7054 RepID=A0A1Y1JWU5_PHOPY
MEVERNGQSPPENQQHNDIKKLNTSTDYPTNGNDLATNRIMRSDKLTNTKQSNKQRKDLAKKEKHKWRIATWNVRGLNGKEEEISDELRKLKLDVIAITETKRKGRDEIKLDQGHVMLSSGVPQERRAAAGVACIIHHELAKNIRKWEPHSERILTVELTMDDQTTTIITVYGPDENEKVEVKENFWEKLNQVTEKSKGNIIVAGDFNGRVGNKDTHTGILGNYGECTKNNNGIRLINYCQLNNLVITNTFFQHRNIHTYTRVGPKNEKSIIDYILVERQNRRTMKDVRVMRGAELYTDHFLVVATLKRENGNDTKVRTKENKPASPNIKSYKLRDTETATLFKNMLAKKTYNEIEVENIGIEESWKKFKNRILETAREICGEHKGTRNDKKTEWWNKEIKDEVKAKKNLWKKYLQNRTEAKYEEYKNQRAKVKNMVKQAKEQSWIKFGEKMETNSKENQKLFYKVLKNMRTGKQKQISSIMDKDGNILTEDDEIMDRWKEYFRDLLDHRSNEQNNKHSEQTKNATEDETEKPITKEEINEAIKSLKNGKAPGYDKITTEMLKNLDDRGTEMFWKLCNKIWDEEQIPEDWKIGLIVPIFKKGNARDCNNYRGITLLSAALKTYERILQKRLSEYTEPTLDESQSAFRKGRGVQDHVFTIKQIIEKTRMSRTKTYLAFVDLEKAFDKVQRETVWKSLERRKVDTKLVRAIRSIYNNNINYVIHRNRISVGFETQQGLRQGGVLSPTLFNIFMDEILTTCKPKLQKLHIGYKKLEPIGITQCLFADDLVIAANTKNGLQGNINSWNETLKTHGMKMNINKTKVMIISQGEEEVLNITVDNKVIEQVPNIKYLGVNIERNGNQKMDVDDRINKTMKLYYAMNQRFIKKKEIRTKTKMTVYKTIYRPTLTYGSESWVLTTNMKSKLQAVEMKFLRAVKGVTRIDRLRNTSIREELDIESIQEHIEKKQLNWWGHIQRMNEKMQTKTVWETNIKTRRGPGRPRETWSNEVNKIIIRRGQTVKNAKEVAKDRSEWKSFVN